MPEDLPLFGESPEVATSFDWDETHWDVTYRLLTLGDRKDIARIGRVAHEPELPVLDLTHTIARSLRSVNGTPLADVLAADGDDLGSAVRWASRLYETLADALAMGYRTARDQSIAPGDDTDLPPFSGRVQAYLADHQCIWDEPPARETENAFFHDLAPIPEGLWWCGQFYVVHYKVLTLDARRLLSRILALAPEDQRPHLELQHTLAHSIVCVQDRMVNDVLPPLDGSAFDARLAWVESFPETLAALLADHYDAARMQPRRALAALVADPKAGRAR